MTSGHYHFDIHVLTVGLHAIKTVVVFIGRTTLFYDIIFIYVAFF